MNPTILLQRSEETHQMRSPSDRRWGGGELRADESLNSLALAVLRGGIGSVQAATVAVGTVALLSAVCPRAAKAASYVWEPVLER